MKLTHVLAAVALSASAAGVLATPAEALTCYRVAMDRPPTFTITTIPPGVSWTGGPTVQSYPC